MRISDWSSDVCSSDLWLQLLRHRRIESRRVRHHAQSLRCRLARPAAVGEARHRGAGGGGRMKIRAQIGKVLNLDKCIGCPTCSVTCKPGWTTREGGEVARLKHVAIQPGLGTQ